MTPADADRRLLLRVLVKLMGTAVLLAFAALLISYVLPQRRGDERPAPTQVDLNPLAPGRILKAQWGRRPVLILHLSPAMRHALARPNPALRDPAPITPQARYRVFFDQGTDLNCPLHFVPADATAVPVHPWYGGFRDRCRGSWYDLAGRVYAQQQAQRNLQAPPFSIDGRNHLIIGQE